MAEQEQGKKAEQEKQKKGRARKGKYKCILKKGKIKSEQEWR